VTNEQLDWLEKVNIIVKKWTIGRSFASQPNCFPPGFRTHNVDIWLAYAEEQINIDFFLWNRNGRTDVTLHLTTTFPTRGEIQITGVDLLVM
jgi:hypothetical protein